MDSIYGLWVGNGVFLQKSAKGLVAFSLALIILFITSTLTPAYKNRFSCFLGLGALYPFPWFRVFFSPLIGRGAPQARILTEFFTFNGVGRILLGAFLICVNGFKGLFGDERRS